jgi:3-dehydroquinate dehydratase / shikimate dehydrogenase
MAPSPPIAARAPRLVATLVAPPPAAEDLRRLSSGADCLELRADLAGDVPAAALREGFSGTLLYTLRSRGEGGAFSAARERRRKRLLEASAGFDLVDLEGDRDLAPEVLAGIAAQRRLISWHGPAAEPAALRGRLAQMARTPAAEYKLVPHARHSGEELAPLELLAELDRDDVTLFAGGEIGAWTRIVAPHFGSARVFGSADERPAAPGQLPIARLVRDFGLPRLSPASRLCGVVGSAALGSLSPRLYNAAFAELGIDALYVPFQVEHFGDFWLEVVESATLARLGLPLAGLSVTSPYKEIAFAVAGAASPLANRLEAVNTLIPSRGVWEGESTDGQGVLAALRERGIEPRGRRAAIVGCGGAGRAAALAMALAGARVTLVNRSAERGLKTARHLRLPLVALEELDPRDFEILVHATPLGRAESDELPFAVERCAPDSTVVDLAYGEAPTRLVTEARARGLVGVDGREVLLHQAVPQFRAITGRELPLALGRRVLGLEEEGA